MLLKTAREVDLKRQRFQESKEHRPNWPRGLTSTKWGGQQFLTELLFFLEVLVSFQPLPNFPSSNEFLNDCYFELLVVAQVSYIVYCEG